MSTILHKRTTGETKPNADLLEYGELAINYKTGSEKLYIKNDTDQVLELPLSGMDELSQVFIFDKDVIKHGEVTVSGETKYSLFKTIKWCMDEQGYNVIDCSLVTSNTIETETLVIDKPIKVLFPRTIMTFVGDGHAIHLQSSNVILQGLGRADKVNTTSSEAVADMEGYLNSTLSGTTCIRMTKASYEPHYHIYSRGCKSMTFDNINFVGIRSSLGQSYANGTLYGVGGIYLEKQAPNDTVAGNTVNNCQITNCGIFDTIAHGIYIDTPILSTIKYTSISGAGGHGVFINGGTSIDINTVFVGSANLGGIVCLNLSYSTIMNCASEYNAQAYVLRDCTCISMYSPACEDTKSIGKDTDIWSNGNYGLLLQTTNGNGDPITIEDMNEDTRKEMNGTGLLIIGGKSINVFSFYGKDLGYTDNNTGANTAKSNRFIKIKGKAKGVHIQNPFFVRKNHMPFIKNEIEINSTTEEGTTYYPEGVEIIWDVASETTFTNPPAYITYTGTANVPICDKTQSASVHCGQKYYTNIVFVGDTGIPNTNYE